MRGDFWCEQSCRSGPGAISCSSKASYDGPQLAEMLLLALSWHRPGRWLVYGRRSASPHNAKPAGERHTSVGMHRMYDSVEYYSGLPQAGLSMRGSSWSPGNPTLQGEVIDTLFSLGDVRLARRRHALRIPGVLSVPALLRVARYEQLRSSLF
jgi:hypothetical protein